MSIIIKGMEMPKCCDECPFCDYEQGNCFANNERNTLPHDGMRRDWCPLVEVPKHGRLIDADELKCMIPTIEDEYKHCRRILDSAPTIIEAEE